MPKTTFTGSDITVVESNIVNFQDDNIVQSQNEKVINSPGGATHVTIRVICLHSEE